MPPGSSRLHSAYDPKREAERYLNSIKPDFPPAAIIVSEPGDSYLASCLRTEWPNAFIVALRYQSDEFLDTDSLWDAVWRPSSIVGLTQFLFDLIPDEALPLAFFMPWKPSDSLWPEAARMVWSGIATCIRLQQSIMHTRHHFGNRWLSNMVNNASRCRNIVRHPVFDSSVFLAAAGPSLEKNAHYFERTMPLLAVSSALTCLTDAGRIPDLVFATDGGYWARRYLSQVDTSSVLAISAEAAVPNGILEKGSIAFLDYGSAFERELFTLVGITGEPASRNGTVAGTAALYALAHCSGNVYVSGLDLTASQSFTHARPHVDDNTIATDSSRLCPVSTILCSRNMDTASLDTYASWFETKSSVLSKRLIRLSPVTRVIPGIPTIGIREISAQTDHAPGASVKPVSLSSRGANLPVADRGERIAQWLNELAQKIEEGITSLSDLRVVQCLQYLDYTGYLRVIKRGASYSATQLSNDAVFGESASKLRVLADKVLKI